MASGHDDTIYARASAAGRAGVAVFRLSGPDAGAIMARLSGKNLLPRQARLSRLTDPRDGSLIDEGLVLWFPGTASFTGEDVAEFQGHGSLATERALYAAFAACGARLAEAGEFTRRALINGKLDLAQAEALSDLIESETALQRKQALGQLGGRLSDQATAWREQLIAIAAPLEADIDFPDEDDVPAAVAARAGPVIDTLLTALRRAAENARAGARVREGVRIALIGAPNAGKSSLLNRMAGNDRAIVSDMPGTTRDVIDVRLDLNGLAVTLFDTAGLRDQSGDAIEKEGMRRSLDIAATADVRIFLVDVSRETTAPALIPPNIAAPALSLADVSRETGAEAQPGDLLVFNKSDLISEPAVRTDGGILVSAKTGAGMDIFLNEVVSRVETLSGASDYRLLTRQRHLDAVSRAIPLLENALGQIGTEPELAAEDVRLAARALGTITGAVDAEDLLEAIFSRFCIGK